LGSLDDTAFATERRRPRGDTIMASDTRNTLVIQRAICYLIAVAGVLLLWISSLQAGVPTIPTVVGPETGFTPEATIPDPATLAMLTAGIGAAFVKLRG